MKEQHSLLSSFAVHVVSCNHSLSKSVCRVLSNPADVRIFKEHLPLHGGEGLVENGEQGGERKNLILDPPAPERVYNAPQNEKCRNQRSTRVEC